MRVIDGGEVRFGNLQPVSVRLIRPAPPRAKSRDRSQTLLMLGADLLLIWTVSVAAVVMRFGAYTPELVDPYSSEVLIVRHLGFLLLYSAVVVLMINAHDLYRVSDARSAFQQILAVLQSVGGAALALMGMIYLSNDKSISRLVVGSTVLLTAVCLVSWRMWWRRRRAMLAAAGIDVRNLLLVGEGDVAAAITDHFARHKHLGYVVRGVLDSRGLRQSSAPPRQAGANGFVSAPLADLEQIVRETFADEVVITPPMERESVKDIAARARKCGLDVTVVPDLYDGLGWGAPIEYLGPFPTMQLHERGIPVAGLCVKRVVDIVGSLLGLLILSPGLLLLAIAVKIGSRGPVFYRSRRIGKKGRTFDCLKFRTMVRNADALRTQLEAKNERDGILFKIARDPRITGLGAFLRKYSLDELPQLWNVLKGDMSLVGPRPPIAGEYEQYHSEDLRRLEVVPGMTGLWQVSSRQDPSFAKYVQLDLEYIQNWSLALDLKILLKTFKVVIAGTGQ